MYGVSNPHALMGPFTFWEAQVNLGFNGYATTWGGLEEPQSSPRHVLDRIIARGKEIENALVQGRYMIGDRVMQKPLNDMNYNNSSC